MTDLQRLKDLIDEATYPFFEDAYLEGRLAEDGATVEELAKELCIVKAGIEEIKLGDITIPSPRIHFLTLAKKYRTNQTGVVVRYDEQP